MRRSWHFHFPDQLTFESIFSHSFEFCSSSEILLLLLLWRRFDGPQANKRSAIKQTLMSLWILDGYKIWWIQHTPKQLSFIFLSAFILLAATLLGWCCSCRRRLLADRIIFFTSAAPRRVHLNGKYKVTIDYSHPSALESGECAPIRLSVWQKITIDSVSVSECGPPRHQERWMWGNTRWRIRSSISSFCCCCFCMAKRMAGNMNPCAALKLHPLMETDYSHNSLFPAIRCFRVYSPAFAYISTAVPSALPISQWTCQHNNINGVPEYTWHAEEQVFGFQIYASHHHHYAIRIGRSSVPERIRIRIHLWMNER